MAVLRQSRLARLVAVLFLVGAFSLTAYAFDASARGMTCVAGPPQCPEGCEIFAENCNWCSLAGGCGIWFDTCESIWCNSGPCSLGDCIIYW